MLKVNLLKLMLFEYYLHILQCTMSIILLLTVGGTPLDAMHRYAPICKRLTRVMLNTEPSMLVTENHINHLCY